MLLTQALLPYNIFFSLLLTIIVLYWLMVIIGFLADDALDFDFDLDGDFGDIVAFLHLGSMPFTAWLSLFALFGWLLSVNSQYAISIFIGQDSWVTTRAIAGGIVFSFMSALLTALFALFFGKFIKKPKIQEVDNRRLSLIGRKVRITSTKVTKDFGNGEVESDGAPIIVDVRCFEEDGVLLDQVCVIDSYDQENDFFWIRKIS